MNLLIPEDFDICLLAKCALHIGKPSEDIQSPVSGFIATFTVPAFELAVAEDACSFPLAQLNTK